MPESPLDAPDTNSSDRTLSTGGPGGPAAGQIGPYRLRQQIGEGGMGEVWLAEQKTPIHRTVALKLIKAGMDTKNVVARFESERQALALMDHPNIAQVYDAGSTPEGRPYFVMEYVPGLPITEYCDKHRLTMRERLELFEQVCDGVQHAHQKAIIHRDLKPSNILVVEQGDKPVPKIIDFGVAKAMSQRLTEKTFFTEMGVLVGTPEYMSPEQADLREQNIDTRTDVYSLGVILYELLAGALPFDAKTLRAAGLEAILRVIREVEPPKPSTKVRSLGESSAATAEKRREEPRSFARRLQGELDWITLKALEKDRARRYGTPNELAADIARYLRNEPVVAGPATAGYRIKKYAARHRVGFAVAACVVVLLIGFVIAQAVELHRIRLERDRANRERERANRISDFMTGMFRVSDPSEARGNTITAREILDKASAQIDTGLAQDPELQAQMMYTMGFVYGNLGLYKKKTLLVQRSMEIRERVLGPQNPQTLRSAEELAESLFREGRYDEAAKLIRQTLAAQRRVLAPADPDIMDSQVTLGNVLDDSGHFEEAEKVDRDAIAEWSRVRGADDTKTLACRTNLAIVLNDEGRYADAETVDRATLADKRRVYGDDHPSTLLSMGNLATDLGMEGKFAEAESLQREGLAIQKRILGPEHPRTLSSMNNLADTLIKEGKYDEAEPLLLQAREIQRRVIGPQNPDTAVTTYSLACLATHRGRNEEALSLLREAMENGLPPYITSRLDEDDDLKPLRGDPRFMALVAHAKEAAAAAQKSK